MGLTTWENAPHGKILKTDVFIAKNYLTSEEINSLGRIVNAYLELAEDRAKRQIPMTMEDWAKRLDKFLEFDERDILTNSGKISTKIAKDHAESEFEKYRIIQDRLFESDPLIIASRRGFEPPTCPLGGGCAIHLCHRDSALQRLS